MGLLGLEAGLVLRLRAQGRFLGTFRRKWAKEVATHLAQGRGEKGWNGETATPHFPFQPQDFPGRSPTSLMTSYRVRGHPAHTFIAQRGN